ncbi:MAG: hypothetical protein CL916_13275 [Deltaproteobacteria bacterium]|nr:hypothetical protein [Deltaproteobacteria bacterium]
MTTTVSQLLQDSPFPIMHTNTDGLVLSFNASCERILRIQGANWKGKNIINIFPTSQQSHIHQLIADPELFPHVDCILPLESQTLELDIFVQHVSAGLLWFIKDQTKYNELIREKKRNQTIPQTYGHDINNFLTVIMSATQLIEMELEPESPFHEDIADILEASHRAAIQTKQFMNIGRQEHINHTRFSLVSFLLKNQKRFSELLGQEYTKPSLAHDMVYTNQSSVEIAIIMSIMHLKKLSPYQKWALSLHEVYLRPPLSNQIFGILAGKYACISISNLENERLETMISNGQYINQSEAPLLVPVWNSMTHCRGTVIQRAVEKDLHAVSLYIPLQLDEDSP